MGMGVVPTPSIVKFFSKEIFQEKASAEIRGEFLRTKSWVNFAGDFLWIFLGLFPWKEHAVTFLWETDLHIPPILRERCPSLQRQSQQEGIHHATCKHVQHHVM